MAQQFKKKKPTGTEYVLATKAFFAYTLCVIEKFPDKWQRYCLDPLFAAADEISKLVIEANAAYVPDKDEEAVKALEERVEYLSKALRVFKVYDYRFDVLMQRTNLMKSEETRFKNTILRQMSCAVEEVESGHPNIKIDVNVNFGVGKIHDSVNGKEKTIKLGLTGKNKAHLLELENKAREKISYRISKDRGEIQNLKEKLKNTELNR